jgi:hypothetical protein
MVTKKPLIKLIKHLSLNPFTMKNNNKSNFSNKTERDCRHEVNIYK